MISANVVEKTWKQMAQTSIFDVPKLIDQMKNEQPEVLSYLLAMDHFPFNQHEKETVFYIGMVVWRIMRQHPAGLKKVECSVLLQVEEENERFLRMLESDTEADFFSATEAMVEAYQEPEVLRYILDALMDEEEYSEDDPPIRDLYRGLAFLHLKNVLDAMIVSTGSEA